MGVGGDRTPKQTSRPGSRVGFSGPILGAWECGVERNSLTSVVGSPEALRLGDKQVVGEGAVGQKKEAWGEEKGGLRAHGSSSH